MVDIISLVASSGYGISKWSKSHVFNIDATAGDIRFGPMDEADAGFTTVLSVAVVGIMFALPLLVETVLGLLLVGSRDIMEAAARAKSSSMVTDTVHTCGIGKEVVADFFIRGV